MNQVNLSGRLTKDPEIRYTQSQKAVCRFNLAVDRMAKGEADFPTVVAFGKQAENMELYVARGCRVLVEGRLQTGNYKDKDGKTVYTTEVIANRVEFIDFKEKTDQGDNFEPQAMEPDVDFQTLDEDVPF